MRRREKAELFVDACLVQKNALAHWLADEYANALADEEDLNTMLATPEHQRDVAVYLWFKRHLLFGEFDKR